MPNENTENDDEDEWNPQPAELRDGETRDVDSHARRNLEQIKRAVEDDHMDLSEVSEENRDEVERMIGEDLAAESEKRREREQEQDHGRE